MAEAADSQAPPGPGVRYGTSGSTGGESTATAGGPAGAPAPPGRRRVRLPAPAARRRWRRRAATVLLAALPVLAGSALPAGAAAQPSRASGAAPHAAPAAGQSLAHQARQASAQQAAAHPQLRTAGTGSRSVEVSLNQVTPSVPADGDTLTLSGTLTNTSRTAVGRARLDVRSGPKLDSRSAIEQAGARKGYLSGADGTAVARKYSREIGGIAPGVTRPFSIKVPVSALHLDADGVHQIAVSLTGRARGRGYDQVLGIGRTFVPRQQGSPGQKTKFTYLWPLMSTPHLTARTEPDDQQTPVFQDESLIDELKPGGRLQEMVELGKDLPVTWVLDPDLIATADMMSRRYRVAREDGGTTAGKGQEYARQWLDELEKAVQGKEVVALPFADPDLASLAHRGKDVPGALSSLGSATALGRKAIEVALHTKPSTDFAWPYEGAVDPSIVDVATSAGARNIIARSDSIRDSRLPYTPTSARPIGGGTTALVADARLSKEFEGDMTRAGTASLAVQEFVSQSLSLARQMPTRQRSVVVAPQRRPTTSQAQAMAAGIRAVHGSNWAEAQRLSDAADARPDPGADRRVPGAAHYPAALRRTELPKAAFEQVRDTKDTLDDFKVILSRADRVVPPFGNAIDREISNTWRGDVKGAVTFRDAVQKDLLDLKRKVRLIKKSDITLSGREATIPVTVQNNLFQRVDGLELELSSSRIGLDVGDAQQVKVDGGHSQSIKFDTTAKNNGRAIVYAQLYTADHKPYGEVMKFRVNVTSITSTVLIVIAVGVLLMVLAGVRMYTQRKRRGPPPDPDALLEPGPDDGDGSADDGKSGGAGPRDEDGPHDEDGTGKPGPASQEQQPQQDEKSDEKQGGKKDENRGEKEDTAEQEKQEQRQEPEKEKGPDEDRRASSDAATDGGSAAGRAGTDTGRQTDSPLGTGEKVER
ncbi:DUF6049 family protein [Streptomyces sp. NRRL F-5053]|uniref:DUF6049 family protein n=1 Tax=Streptomyces sp. NRRL F-5053 TaxID=1463854 RepID=UPI0004C5044B|nr:DUF6049 family protein [Streptomyces sp. NRRL F-5053]